MAQNKRGNASHLRRVHVPKPADFSNAPFFIRLGSRTRAPEGVATGSIRRMTISNVVVSDADTRYASIIGGIPPREPFATPEREKEYSEAFHITMRDGRPAYRIR